MNSENITLDSASQINRTQITYRVTVTLTKNGFFIFHRSREKPSYFAYAHKSILKHVPPLASIVFQRVLCLTTDLNCDKENAVKGTTEAPRGTYLLTDHFTAVAITYICAPAVFLLLPRTKSDELQTLRDLFRCI